MLFGRKIKICLESCAADYRVYSAYNLCCVCACVRNTFTYDYYVVELTGGWFRGYDIIILSRQRRTIIYIRIVCACVCVCLVDKPASTNGGGDICVSVHLNSWWILNLSRLVDSKMYSHNIAFRTLINFIKKNVMVIISGIEFSR